MKGIVNTLKFTIGIIDDDVEVKSFDNTNFLILLNLLGYEIKLDSNMDYKFEGTIASLIGKDNLKKILKLYLLGEYNAKTYNEYILKIANNTYTINIPYMNELLISDKYIVGCEGVKFNELPDVGAESLYEVTLNIFTVKLTDDIIYSSMIK